MISDQLEQCLNNLSYYKPDDNDMRTDMATVRGEAKTLACMVNSFAPDGRDKAVAFTKIEEACQAGIAAIARGRGIRQDDGT